MECSKIVTLPLKEIETLLYHNKFVQPIFKKLNIFPGYKSQLDTFAGKKIMKQNRLISELLKKGKTTNKDQLLREAFK